jgi:hypothetical protein
VAVYQQRDDAVLAARSIMAGYPGAAESTIDCWAFYARLSEEGDHLFVVEAAIR